MKVPRMEIRIVVNPDDILVNGSIFATGCIDGTSLGIIESKMRCYKIDNIMEVIDYALCEARDMIMSEAERLIDERNNNNKLVDGR